MRWVPGFREQILDALTSPDPAIRREAVEAAGNWELEEAWPHIMALLENTTTPKAMLLAAIGAAAAIRPAEAGSPHRVGGRGDRRSRQGSNRLLWRRSRGDGRRRGMGMAPLIP
jgi:hypothetical protein